MKSPEQEAKELVTIMLKKMSCCVEDLPNHIENGMAKEVSLSAVDKILSIIEEDDKQSYWKKVRDHIKNM